jgi:hypothetical protein
MRRVQHWWQRGTARIEGRGRAHEPPNRSAWRFALRKVHLAVRAAIRARGERAREGRLSLPSRRAASGHNCVAMLAALAAARSAGLALLCVLSMAGSTPTAAATNPAEAALIVKIGKFVHWPVGTFTSSGGVLRLCVLGADDGNASIDTLAGQTLQGKVIAVARLSAPDHSVAECHIVLVRKSEGDRLAAVLEATAHSPVLTISDIEGFAAAGGMVGFGTTGGATRFEINVAASKRAGLSIGAQLLQIAALSASEHADASP